MRWTRKQNGVYTSGPYTVEETYAPRGEHNWHASGPDLDSNWLRKAEAQRATEEVAKRRIGTGLLVEPVVGDVADYAGVRCQVSAVMSTNDGTPLYCLRLPRSKRQCLLRHEFRVVLP